VVHATTLLSNAVIERKGAPAGLLSALPTEIVERPSFDALRAAIGSQSFQFFVSH
jgi:hypothetical protein